MGERLRLLSPAGGLDDDHLVALRQGAGGPLRAGHHAAVQPHGDACGGQLALVEQGAEGGGGGGVALAVDEDFHNDDGKNVVEQSADRTGHVWKRGPSMGWGDDNSYGSTTCIRYEGVISAHPNGWAPLCLSL